MQLSNAPGKLLLPFANAGAKNTIPTASQIGITAGAASLTDGFPPLTRTPIAAGGVPPSGLDMNGILYALSAALRWANAGGGYVYDGTFAADSNVGGYPKGARVLRSDGAGYWLNTIDGNTVDPESVTVNAAQVAGWVPDLTNGIAAITMTNANVTLTPSQYGKLIVVISGVLTANLNLIFPNLVGEWVVVNKTSGPYSITCKTSSGTGVNVYGNCPIICDSVNIEFSGNYASPGSIIYSAANSAPSGYLKANGAAVSRSSYSALFAAIGTTYGVGDGSTTFNLPDLRGEFLRGYDDGRNVDSGRVFGSSQSNSDRTHKHVSPTNDTAATLSVQNARGTGWAYGATAIGNAECNALLSGVSNLTTGEDSWLYTGPDVYISGESRPRNVAMLACVKF